jgi:hypothetical protein
MAAPFRVLFLGPASLWLCEPMPCLTTSAGPGACADGIRGGRVMLAKCSAKADANTPDVNHSPVVVSEGFGGTAVLLLKTALCVHMHVWHL